MKLFFLSTIVYTIRRDAIRIKNVQTNKWDNSLGFQTEKNKGQEHDTAVQILPSFLAAGAGSGHA